MPNSYLYKNQGTATNAKKFTLSMWIKRSKVPVTADGNTQRFYQGYETSNNRFYAYFTDDNKLWIYAVTGGTIELHWVSNRLFRDTNAWYHIVFKGDTTQAAQADRFRVYVNGVEETSWTKNYNISQNVDWGNLIAHTNGDLTISGTESQGQMFDGYMSHVAFVDGQALAPTEFGEIDSTSGIWKIKSPSGITWGNTGYHLKFENSANLGLDSSGNSNNFTVGGNLKQAIDNPSNVHATLNDLDSYYQADTLSNANLTMVGGGQYAHRTASIGLDTGKWYWEIQTNNFESSDQTCLGISSEVATAANY